ncbi:MAG: MBL fold metallo-hydrolase [Myxococcales bacterium]|nr:MBL fold metallo-hydrolase [Myxococcales bacterium]
MTTADGIFVHQFELGPWQNFLYFIGDRATRSCAVVDPAWDVETIFQEAERLDVQIDHVLCTHSHFDHVNKVDDVLRERDVPVHMLGAEIDFADFRCENLERHAPGDVIRVGDHLEITMIHTPGHTPGSTTYRIRDAIVTGDTLFVEGCGRCDFVGGDPETMYRTLRKLTASLPPMTRMYPGHNYGPTPVSSLDAELRDNPYLQHTTVEDFVRHRMEGKTPGTNLPPPPAWP